MIEQLLRTRSVTLLTALAGAAMLGGAYIFQYGFGYQPCTLCLYQRLPWWIAIGVACVGLSLARRLPNLLPVFTILAGLTVLVGAGIAGYHSGVEYGWWEGPAGCTGSTDMSNMTLEEMKKAILATPVVRCDDVPWSLFGISMAGYNFLISLAVGLFAVVFGWRNRQA